jgi:flagellar biosynthetic protein FlhB
MADKPAAERTEQPTEERLRKAREEGQVAQSEEVPSALIILIFVVMLGFSGPALYHWLITETRRGLSFTARPPMDAGAFCGLLTASGSDMLLRLLPFLITAMAAGTLGSLLVSGLNFSPKALGVKLENLSPFKGIAALFSLRSLVRLGVSMVKMVVIAIAVVVYLQDKKEEILTIGSGGAEEVVISVSRLVMGVASRVVIWLVAIAAIDMLYQRWQARSTLKMTRQEVKEEREEHELPQEVKGRMRSMMIALTKRRMLTKVKTADVVITNPTHVAVAIRYDSAKMQAPQVVAKGADHLAQKIKEIAKEANVAVMERPELARTLYATVEVDGFIPESLFVAVAGILAMIYRLRKKRPWR